MGDARPGVGVQPPNGGQQQKLKVPDFIDSETVFGCVFWGILALVFIVVWVFRHQWLDSLNAWIGNALSATLNPPLFVLADVALRALGQLTEWLGSDVLRLEWATFLLAVGSILLPKPKSWENDWSVIVGVLILVAGAGVVWYDAFEHPRQGLAGNGTYSFVMYGLAIQAFSTVSIIGFLTFSWLDRVGTALAVAFLGGLWVFYVSLFAYSYLLLSAADPGAFSEGKLVPEDALYLAVTTFTTIGSGSLQPMHHSARLLVASQTTLDFVLIAAAVAIVLNWYTGRLAKADQEEGASS
jgi:hypothetical protein